MAEAGATFECRIATFDDLEALVELLADDWLGSQRESRAPDNEHRYRAAFAAIAHDPNNELVVATLDARVVGMLQLTYIPGLTRQGMERAQIEGVRVASNCRGRGVGQQLFIWAIERAQARGCGLVQLTTDKRRFEAHRFYAQLGFEATHEGMKLPLNQTPSAG